MNLIKLKLKKIEQIKREVADSTWPFTEYIQIYISLG